MVRRVPGQMQNVEREALDPDRVAVSEFPIRRKAWIDEGVAEAGNARAARRSRRPERGHSSADERLQSTRAVTVVAMTVRNENIGEALALDGGRDRLQMTLVGGTRIDDGYLAASDDVAVGAEKRVGPGIVGNNPASAGANLLGHAIIDILAAVEGKLRRHDLCKLFVFSLIACCNGAHHGRQRHPPGSVNFAIAFCTKYGPPHMSSPQLESQGLGAFARQNEGRTGGRAPAFRAGSGGNANQWSS